MTDTTRVPLNVNVQASAELTALLEGFSDRLKAWEDADTQRADDVNRLKTSLLVLAGTLQSPDNRHGWLWIVGYLDAVLAGADATGALEAADARIALPPRPTREHPSGQQPADLRTRLALVDYPKTPE